MAPAFSDFGPLSERRRAERQQRQRKRIIVAATSIIVLLLIAAVAFVAVVQLNKHEQTSNKSSGTHKSSSSSGGSSSSSSKDDDSSSSKASDSAKSKGEGDSSDDDSPSTPAAPTTHTASKMVDALCSSTDYKQACHTSLKKAGEGDATPKDLVKAAISSISDALVKALDKSDLIKSDDPMVKGAIEDCKELFTHAKDELTSSVDTVEAGELSQMANNTHDIKNWLSAVVSYQQTCVDGFPEGDLKTKMQDAVNTSRQLTSNALAIVTEATSLLSGLGLRRRLLEDETPLQTAGESHRDEDGLPSWMTDGERRFLKEADAKKLKPNVVVSKDGSGDFKTITDALKAIPKKHEGRYNIYVKEGVYDESPIVTKDMVNVTMYGDGSRKTIVTGNKNFVDGVRTFQTATFAAIGEGFVALSMGFRNTAGAIKHQAVALRVQSDRSVFLNCRMEAYQDTLYAQTHRQYYRSCVIAGTVDFVFGDAAAVFQNCVFLIRKPLENQQNIVTAQGRVDKRESTGFVLQASRFEAEPELAPTTKNYLARPWKEYSRTIIMESTIPEFIQPDGYMPWEGDFALKTLFYAEYNNKGPGADVAKRVKWPGVKVINKDEALGFTVETFLQGASWIKAAGAPVRLGLFG